MAIDFTATFGNRNAQRGAANGNRQDLPKAQFWLNFGYMAGEGDNEKFVSLPTGIPLDTMERVSVRSSNQEFAMYQAARNALLDQLLEAAAKLEPGDDYVINADGGLAIQIRRVNAEQAAPSTGSDNPFARKLFNVEAAA
jgi:hypothetical protein